MIVRGSTPYRIGMIVPSSNTTMETEVPEILRRRAEVAPESFTFHSSRVRMQHVTKEELTAMVHDSDRCALELSDARVDVIAYACLVAIMSQGPGYHSASEERLAKVAAENGGPAPVVSSAGALVRGIQALGPNNLDVGRHDPMRLPEIASRLRLEGAEAVVLSACVQMRSLPAIAVAERQLGLPVLSAAVATAFDVLDALGLERVAARSGALLAGQTAGAPSAS